MNLNLAFVFAAFFSVTQAAIRSSCTNGGVVALTFDDGPADYTGQLLNALNSKGIKATFHITTQYLTDPNVQATIQNIAAGGHLIGLRTEPSWNLFAMSDSQIKASIARQSQVLAEFIGYQPILIVLPYQKYDDRVLAAVESTGAVVTGFNLDSYDYTGDSNRIMKAFQVPLSLAGPGAGSFIAVQHDGVAASVALVPQIIDYIKSQNYKMIKLDECLGLGDLTKNKKALDGGNGSAAPMEIDSSSSGSLPTPGSGSSSGVPRSTGGSSTGGKKPSGSKAASAGFAAKPITFTAVAAALVSLFFAF